MLAEVSILSQLGAGSNRIPLNGENNHGFQSSPQLGAGSNGKGHDGVSVESFQSSPEARESNAHPKAVLPGITVSILSCPGAGSNHLCPLEQYPEWFQSSQLRCWEQPLLVFSKPCRESVSILSQLRCWEQREFSADDEPDNEFQSSPSLGAGSNALHA